MPDLGWEPLDRRVDWRPPPQKKIMPSALRLFPRWACPFSLSQVLSPFWKYEVNCYEQKGVSLKDTRNIESQRNYSQLTCHNCQVLLYRLLFSCRASCWLLTLHTLRQGRQATTWVSPNLTKFLARQLIENETGGSKMGTPWKIQLENIYPFIIFG